MFSGQGAHALLLLDDQGHRPAIAFYRSLRHAPHDRSMAFFGVPVRCGELRLVARSLMTIVASPLIRGIVQRAGALAVFV